MQESVGTTVRKGLLDAIGTLSPYPLVQLGWSVPDLQQAMKSWISVTGVGPFYYLDHVPLRNILYRGEPTTFDHSCAIGWWGGIEVELMQQHDDSPSHLREAAPGGHGFASVSWFAPDLGAETRRLEALGFPLVWTGEFGADMSACWFDARHIFGAMIEVFPEHPVMRQGFKALEEAAARWDGTAPIRPMAELFATGALG